MPLRKPKILIVGGGIAGLALAAYLEKKSLNYTLVERVSQWTARGGGILLMMNGCRVLADLGVLPQVRQAGNTFDEIHIHDTADCRLNTFDLLPYRERALEVIGIHRMELHNILRTLVDPARVRLGVQPEAVEVDPEAVRVEFSDQTSGTYDLVIGCDGIYSGLRQLVFPEASLQYAGYSCWRFLGRNDGSLLLPSATEWWGRGKRFSVVPISEELVHCFAAINTEAGNRQFKQISKVAFADHFREFPPLVARMIDTLPAAEDLIYNDLEDVLLHNWHKGRVLLIGDAAHGMTPNITQGASLALEDARILIDMLSHTNWDSAAFGAFQQARRPRVFRIMKKSRMLGRIGQLESKVLIRMRNLLWKNLPNRLIQSDFERSILQDVY